MLGQSLGKNNYHRKLLAKIPNDFDDTTCEYRSLIFVLCCRKRIPKVNFQLKHLLILARNSKFYSTYQLPIH